MHRGMDHALAVTRNAFNHVVLECRSMQNCPHSRVVAALGLTNDRVYAETPDELISELGRAPDRAGVLRIGRRRALGRRLGDLGGRPA